MIWLLLALIILVPVALWFALMLATVGPKAFVNKNHPNYLWYREPKEEDNGQQI